MIFNTATFRVRPEDADAWPQAEYVLVEAFRDDAAGSAHVTSAHFAAAQRELPPHLAETPRIGSGTVPQDDWSELGEMAVVRTP